MALKISEEVKVQMPMKTVASLIAIVAIGTWAFFSFQEKLNQHATTLQIMEKDLIENKTINKYLITHSQPCFFSSYSFYCFSLFFYQYSYYSVFSSSV